MRLKKVTAKNGHITYSIIKDYTRLDGKRTSTTYELLGDDLKLPEATDIIRANKNLYAASLIFLLILNFIGILYYIIL